MSRTAYKPMMEREGEPRIYVVAPNRRHAEVFFAEMYVNPRRIFLINSLEIFLGQRPREPERKLWFFPGYWDLPDSDAIKTQAMRHGWTLVSIDDSFARLLYEQRQYPGQPFLIP